MEFQKTLLRVQDFLSPADVSDLTFLCYDLLEKDLSGVTAARDLFSLLQSHNLLSPDDPSLLTELLQITNRSGLLRDLHLGTCPQLPSSRISPYRRLLYKLADNISSDDLKNFKFLLNKTLPRKRLQQDVTMLQLFWEMEKENLLDADNLDILEQSFEAICPYLKKFISEFKTKHGAGVIASEPKVRSNRDSLDHSVTTKAVQPASVIQNEEMTCTSQIQSVPTSEDPLTSLAFSSPPSAQALSSLASLSGAVSRDIVGQMENLSVRESCSEVQSHSGKFISMDEDTKLSGTDQTNQSDLKLQVYSMTGDCRGFCLIINNYIFSSPKLRNRYGTQTDERRLVEVFQWLGFETQTVQDCDRDGMLQALEDLRCRDHTRADCVVCCVLTHGYDGGVYGVDGTEVTLKELMEPLSGHRCSTLIQKPKIFFVQACQGTESQAVVFLQSDSPGGDLYCDAAVPKESLPSDVDFLLAMATVPFYTSYRDKVKGTWFIQSLCENLLQLVPRGIDLLSILTQVNNDVSTKTDATGTKKQIPQPAFTLRKRVIFPVPRSPPPSS